MIELKLRCGRCGSPFPSHTDICTITTNQIDSLQAQIAALTAERARLRAALEKIAGTRCDEDTCTVIDQFKNYIDALEFIARKALEEK